MLEISDLGRIDELLFAGLSRAIDRASDDVDAHLLVVDDLFGVVVELEFLIGLSILTE
jgi:hypothetical protein